MARKEKTLKRSKHRLKREKLFLDALAEAISRSYRIVGVEDDKKEDNYKERKEGKTLKERLIDLWTDPFFPERPIPGIKLKSKNSKVKSKKF